MRLPDFVMIGAQKSATSFLQTCLDEHPDIFIPHGETPFFRSPDYEDGCIKDISKLFYRRYERLFGIKRPDYLADPVVPARLATHLPDAQLLIVLRNPVDRAISAYFHMMLTNFIPVQDIENGMRYILHDKNFIIKYPQSESIIEYGFYYKQIQRYKKYFREEKIKIILHEDLLKNPSFFVEKTYEFLNVDSDFSPRSIYQRPKKGIHSEARINLNRFRNRLLFYWTSDNMRMHRKNVGMFKYIMAQNIALIDKFFMAQFCSDKKPSISIDLRHELIEIYREDIEALENCMGRSLERWRHS